MMILFRKENKKVLIFCLIFMLFLSLTFQPAFLLRTDLSQTGDDASYIAHAFTIGIDFDLDYSNEITSFNDFKNIMPPHAIGAGIIAAPIVFLGSCIDRISMHPVISDRTQYLFSWSYFGFAIASSFSLYFGFILYASVLLRIFSDKGSFVILVLCIIGSGLIFYSHSRFTMGHSFEFFSISLVIFLSDKLVLSDRNKFKSILLIVLLSISITIAVLTRYANIQAFLLPSILYLFLIITDESKSTKGSWIKIVYASVIGIILFGIVSLFLFNSFFPFWNTLHPEQVEQGKTVMFSENIILRTVNRLKHLIPLFFSSEFGLVWSFPSILFGLGGVFYILIKDIKNNNYRGKSSIFFILAITYVAVPFAVVLNWETTASSYGYRYLFSTMPIILMGILFLFNNSKLSPILRKVLLSVFYLLTLTSCFSQFLFLATPELTPFRQMNVFGKVHSYSARGYLNSLLHSIFDINTWIISFGRTVLLLPVIAIIVIVSISKIIIGDTLYNTLSTHFYSIPSSIWIQITVLFVLWGIAGGYFSNWYKKKYE